MGSKSQWYKGFIGRRKLGYLEYGGNGRYYKQKMDANKMARKEIRQALKLKGKGSVIKAQKMADFRFELVKYSPMKSKTWKKFNLSLAYRLKNIATAKRKYYQRRKKRS